MKNRIQQTFEYHRLTHHLTNHQLTHLLRIARQVAPLAQNYISPLIRLRAWIATFASLTLLIGLAVYITLPPTEPLAPRFLIATFAGYITALNILALRHLQTWRKSTPARA